MRRMAGLELDGWCDHACRGWRLDDATSSENVGDIVEGGYATVVVSQRSAAIGGPQAMNSPIGRGGGWGDVGNPSLRRPLASLWSDFLANEPSPSWTNDIRAATDALTRQAQDIVFCVPDRPEMDEARQQALLSALGGAKRPRVTLLWRPVAMVLAWLGTAEGRSAHEGMRVACLQHASDGFEVQYLTLRALPSEDALLVPERDGFGRVIGAHLGLKVLHDAAAQATTTANGLTLTPLTGRLRLPEDQLFAPCPAPKMEVFRLENGDWRLLSAPDIGVSLDQPGPVTDLDEEPADIVLLSTPLAARHHAWLRSAWATLRVPVQILDPGASSRGSLLAARRIARGTPHYLDRLDQIALVVLRQGEPVFEDLVPANAIVPGNREYVSDPITNMVWGRDMATAQFFLRKGRHEIRRWVTPEVPAPNANEPLVIQLRQRPAQGWAALTIGSRNWDYLARNPIRLDWLTLEPEPRSEQEVLASLRGQRPSVPDRVRQAPGMLGWHGTPGREGLSSLLARFDPDRRDDLADLAHAIRLRPRQDDGSRSGAIGTDGDLPADLSLEAARNLERVIEMLAQYLERHVTSGRPLPNNDALLALTWMYELCPSRVVKEIVMAAKCALAGRRHVFLAPKASTTVILHGAGRIVRERLDIIELISKVLISLNRASSLNNGLGLLEGLLSRPVQTPRVLLEIGIEHLASDMVKILKRLAIERISGSRLKYALISIVSLLRVREIEPWTLIVDRSIHARSLVDIMQHEMKYLQKFRSKAAQESITEIIKLFQGVGGRPDIFSVLENIED